MVRPQLEYAAIVWDPIYNNDIHKLENIQRRAARSVLKYYYRYSSVTSMLQYLSWPDLQTRHKISMGCKHFIKFFTMIFQFQYLPTIFL